MYNRKNILILILVIYYINEPDEFIDSESNCLEDDKNQS